jgi:hypothetical protein
MLQLWQSGMKRKVTAFKHWPKVIISNSLENQVLLAPFDHYINHEILWYFDISKNIIKYNESLSVPNTSKIFKCVPNINLMI